MQEWIAPDVDWDAVTPFWWRGRTHARPHVRTRTHMRRQTGFNKIAIPNNKFQMASGQGSHLAHRESNNFIIYVYPALIRYLSILFLNIFTLLALTQSFGSLFRSFITLCEKEYFLMSNLHCSLTNAALCPLVLLPSLSLKNIFLSTS